MKLKNTVLIVNDLEQSKKFYKHILGLKTILDFHGSVTLTSGIVLQSKEIWKELIHKTDQEIIMLNHAVELSFETEDIDAFMYVLDQISCHTITSFKRRRLGAKSCPFL